MDNTSLKTFLTVVEEGGFRRAATKLGYTQAGISYIIQNLEKEFGLTLFVRNRNGAQLTPEGEMLLPQIKQMDMDNRILLETIDELKGLDRGTLRVQIFDSISIQWIPGILHKFKKDFPGITIELITEEDSFKAEEMVLSGEVDCGFFLTDVTADLDVFNLKEENLLVIVSPKHELADSNCFPVENLDKYPYISMKYDSHTGMMAIFDRYGKIPNTAYCMDNDYAAMAMVSQGLGFCIFPELLLENNPFDIVELNFDKPQKRRVSIGTRSIETASKACIKFIEYTREWVRENT